MEKSFLNEALRYADMGLSVIPIIPGQKKPMIKWQQYQTQRATKEQITDWWTKTPNANIGIVTGDVSDVFVVDIDTEEGQQNLLQYGFETVDCPIVLTPRGGQHLYFKNPTKKITIGAGIIPGTDFRGNGGYVVAPPSVNGNGRRYVWQKNFDRRSLCNLPDAYIKKITAASLAFAAPQGDAINNKYIKGGVIGGETKQPQNDTTTTDHNDHNRPQMFILGTRDNDLFHTANCLVKGGMPDDEIAQVLEKLILSWGENPDKKWIDSKIKSALDRADRRQKNWAEEVRDYITTTDGYITTTDCHKQLQATTTDHKKAINMALLRMKESGIIEKYGEKSGTYKKVEQLEENIIDLSAADTTSLPIKLPLGIHELVKIMPKNIIIVAGESNSGKSAFLLNTAAKNMIDHKVFYFSSEMGGAELKERLQNFNERMPFKMWGHCTFIERANDFDMAIRPNDINIIDFLEIHDEFYKIGGFIKKIFDKLDKGIALIAIQKNKGRDEGLGGARSIEKARLYLSMRPGVIKIVKAKNWVSGLINPNGMEKQFKLAKGMIFSDVMINYEKSGWVKTDD